MTPNIVAVVAVVAVVVAVVGVALVKESVSENYEIKAKTNY